LGKSPSVFTEIKHGQMRIPRTKIGAKIVANIVILGAFNELEHLVPHYALEKSVENSVPFRFTDLNLKVLNRGIEEAKEKKLVLFFFFWFFYDSFHIC